MTMSQNSKKKIGKNVHPIVLRNLHLYDIYECEIQTIYAKVMTQLFETFIDKETSHGMASEQFIHTHKIESTNTK